MTSPVWEGWTSDRQLQMLNMLLREMVIREISQGMPDLHELFEEMKLPLDWEWTYRTLLEDHQLLRPESIANLVWTSEGQKVAREFREADGTFTRQKAARIALMRWMGHHAGTEVRIENMHEDPHGWFYGRLFAPEEVVQAAADLRDDGLITASLKLRGGTARLTRLGEFCLAQFDGDPAALQAAQFLGGWSAAGAAPGAAGAPQPQHDQVEVRGEFISQTAQVRNGQPATSAASGRPKVFIGSSVEGKEIADELQVLLDYDCEVNIWHQGLFNPGSHTLTAMVKAAGSYDFAILVISADDQTESRGDVAPAPRDNVIFELGLFIGALGMERVFMVYDRDKRPKLPSDLLGVNPATFARHASGNLSSALGAPSTQILRVIKERGRIDQQAPRPFDGASTEANTGRRGGSAIESLKAEIDSLEKSAVAQGWRMRVTPSAIRLLSPKKRRFTMELGNREHTRDELRRFASELRAAGLRVSRTVR